MGTTKRHIGIVCSEAIRESMAGIGIRYLEMANHLTGIGYHLTLVHPAEQTDWLRDALPGIECRRFEGHSTLKSLESCDLFIGQGFLANGIAPLFPKIPKVFDFYDPWLVENLTYAPWLGHGPFMNDLASWKLQFLEGDFFLCSSEIQKTFYLGILTALGRINPERLTCDPSLESLVAPVPFGILQKVPEYQPLLGKSNEPHKQILFGGLYDWYDPWTLLNAMEKLQHRSWELWFVKNPNPDSTPQNLLGEMESWLEAHPWMKERVKFLDWVSQDRRFDLLQEADVMVAPHRRSLETRLCMRTRYLDAIAARCPCISSEGGEIADLFTEYGAGLVVKEGDSANLAESMDALLWRNSCSLEKGMAALAKSMTWEKAFAPLVEFCENPRVDFGKKFAKSVGEPSGFWTRMLDRLKKRR